MARPGGTDEVVSEIARAHQSRRRRAACAAHIRTAAETGIGRLAALAES